MRQDASRGGGRQAGFTLIELVVVMVIIAVASLVVYPSVRSGANQRAVRHTLQQFVSVIRRASSMAVMRRETTEVWLCPDQGRYALITRDRPSDGEEDEAEGARSARRIRTLGLVRGEDEESCGGGEGRTVVGAITLPEIAKFGEVESGSFIPVLSNDADVDPDEVVLLEFYPTGSSSGGRVELEFEFSRQRQAYKLVINPLLSSISMEE